MEYYVGFGVAFLLIFIVSKINIKFNILKEPNFKNFQISQSRIHAILPIKKQQINKKNIKRQSRLHDERTNIKVIIMDQQAYWIKDNVFYTANMSGDLVDKDTTRVVDTMSMNRVQLDKMMFIIDRLREGIYDDRGGTRN